MGQVSSLCSNCNNGDVKTEGQLYIDEYFYSLSIANPKTWNNTAKESLIQINEDNFQSFVDLYIRSDDKRFENTHNDLWNIAPSAVFHNNYKFVTWTIILLSDISTQEKITLMTSKDNNKSLKRPKDEIISFLNDYLNFISSFVASMLNEKVKKTSPEDLENCHKFFDKKIRDQYLLVLLKGMENDDKIELGRLLSIVEASDDIRAYMKRLYLKFEAY